MPFWKTFDTASLMERKILPQIDFVATISTTTTLKDDVLGLSKLYSVTSGSMLSSLHVLWVIHSFFWTKSIFDASQETIKKSAYSSSLLTLFVKRKGGENSNCFFLQVVIWDNQLIPYSNKALIGAYYWYTQKKKYWTSRPLTEIKWYLLR